MKLALARLARFQLLAREMKLKSLHAVAPPRCAMRRTAATSCREARRIGIEPSLSRRGEARLAALGVISAIPQARGVVADLGGGSLELTPVSQGTPAAGISLPLACSHRPSQRQASRATLRKTCLRSASRRERADPYLSGAPSEPSCRSTRCVAHPCRSCMVHAARPARVRELRQLVRSTAPEELKQALRPVGTAPIPAAGAQSRRAVPGAGAGAGRRQRLWSARRAALRPSAP
jgi:exopolyphosphatase/guanosine-5'-triphosphate,3'-diphosphate pyrophosphatase